MKTVLRAGCKVNIFLTVTGRLPNGYHTLESLFLPLSDPHDTLEITPKTENGLELTCSDASLDAPDNSVRRAYARYAAATGFAPGLSVFLRKGTPHGAGLGGGSADAAVFLRHLNNLAARKGTALDDAALRRMAAGLGADVPFFLLNGPALARGIGDELTPVAPPLPGWHMVLVCPEIRVSTAWAFQAWDEKNNAENSGAFPVGGLTSEGDTDRNPLVHNWRVENSFESVVLAAYPQLAAIRAKLRSLGADAACMSGTGSSMFGLFREKDIAGKAVRTLRRAGRKVFLHAL